MSNLPFFFFFFFNLFKMSDILELLMYPDVKNIASYPFEFTFDQKQ